MLYPRSISRNYQARPRRFGGFRLDAIGYLRDKRNEIDQAFATFNYSLILSGSGRYRCGEAVYEVRAPCVITQVPGLHVHYGPRPGETWEELYLILDAGMAPRAAAEGLIGPLRFHWPVLNEIPVRRLARSFLAAAEKDAHEPGAVDRLDLMALSLVRETLLPSPFASDHQSAAVYALAERMQESFDQVHDVEAFAREYGLSLSTFMRRWRERFPVPPGEYLLALRISEAGRLLAETNDPIQAVAAQCGFYEPAYFSRFFARRIGMSPTAYRGIHRGAGG